MAANLSKEVIIKAFIEKFQGELSALIQSAKAAHSAATHEESRAEDRHDTFAIEASYLAAGQAARVEELQKTVQEFEGYLASNSHAPQIGKGSLVNYELDGVSHFAFFSIHGGGSKIQIGSTSIQILSLKSPIGEELEQAKAGDSVEFEIRGVEKSYEIISVS